MSLNTNASLQETVLSFQEELKELIRRLCALPAPSHHEELRAAFCKRWFEENGFSGVIIDDAMNVICPLNVTESNDLAVLMAHTDTVFPDTQPMPFEEKDGKMFSPGVTDDTANLAVLMLCARQMLRSGRKPKTGLLIVANSCEEGLGNLKGTRTLFETYGNRIREMITIDGSHLPSIVTEAVGSHRYHVTVLTEGGHSFGSFGNRNAIHCLSSIINTLYTVKVPVEGNSRTTYNVGLISGGTSVNTIAQQAEMCFEYRSDHVTCLEKMERMFFQVIEAYRSMGIEVLTEKIGDRPCAAHVDAARHQELIFRAASAIEKHLGEKAQYHSGSTDANIPLSLGIPAICISACHGGGAHTREEWLDVESLKSGSLLVLDILGSYFEN